MNRARGKTPRKKRRLLKSVAALFATGVLVIVALPLWLPWILPSLLNAFQAGYSEYERLGYSRLALHDFHFERRKIRIEAGRVELWTPLAWFWKRHAAPADSPSAQPFVLARDWKFEVLEKDLPPRPPPRPYDSTVEVLDQVDALLPVLRDWLPSAQLANGRFVVLSEVFEIPSVEIDRGNVRIALAHARLNQEARVTADLSGESPHRIEVSIPTLDLVTSHRLATSNQDWSLESTLTWRTNRIDASNHFAGEGWLPSSASLVATEFRLPGELAKAEAYYQDLQADLDVQWESGTIEARLKASAEPVRNDLALPPLSADVLLSGNTNALHLESFVIRLPWIDAELSQPLTLLRSAPWMEGQARLDVSARLNELSLDSVSGEVTGVLEIEPGPESDYPIFRVMLTGTDIQSPAGLVEELRLSGRLAWPRLELDSSMARLADSFELRTGGSYDFATKEMDGVEWSIAGVPPGEFMPADLGIGEVKASGTIAGNLRRPAHTGEIQVARVESPYAPPADLHLVWEGEGGQFRELSLKAGAGESSVDLSGEVRIETSPGVRADLLLDRLIVALPDQVRYSLRNRLSAVWRLEPAEADDEGPGPWELSVDEFVLEGGERRFSARAQLSWPERGDVHLTWQGARLADFRDFITSPFGESRLDEFELRAAWNNGPADLDLKAGATLIAGDGRPLGINAQMISDVSGVHFQPLVIAGPVGEIASLRGSLPVQILPGQPLDPVRLLETGAMDLRLATRANPAFWGRVGEITGVELENPEAEIILRGRPDSPEGTIRFDASSVKWKPEEAQLESPPLDNVHLLAVITPDELRLDEFSLTVQQQPVAASGRWPLSPDSWMRIRNREMPDWQEASAELNVDSAEIAAFTSYLPLLLAPQGRIDLNLRLESGSLDGRLELHDAATRPVPPMGPLRAIEARMQFSEQEAEIEEFRAELGGQPVRMDGTVTFAGTGLPEFNLKLQGTNVPLARQPGLVLRSDLDLRVARANGEPALISGALGLRHSLFLQDITSLKPGRLAEPSRRPPYFSVDQDPFSTWRLDLKITGQEFLRVRSPLFKGSISANLELRGTLEEPSALGEVRIDEGQIQFPFATLAVDQGTINLSSDNPYEPQLFINASGRNYGYEIRMEIEGSASEPSVVFSSNPPLNSEDIVLMLTAGEVPTSEFTFSNQQKASRLAMFFGRNLLTRLGADEATAERLSIRSGEHISETGKLTYHLEYELTDRWSLVGEYDRFNALNAGLKWRVYSK